MKLYAAVAAAIIATVALCFLARWGRYEGRQAAYQMRVAECERRYPHYRCVVELARDFPEAGR